MIDNHPNITQQSHPNISSKHNATIAKTMTFFLGNLVEVGKEYRTGRRDSDGGRAYILEQSTMMTAMMTREPSGPATQLPITSSMLLEAPCLPM